ncbi:exocyst complex component EXO70H1-like [Salvia miltiorrhiza]|uniref:exocyst complex component EXO70H1-like n=1 Tax=Salvia miltiorrhiza TaxID=226208 RepID=UPI0025ABB1E6|nr:exocyst complex component EXO70H1-like [Salvia miltiorrhiza]
MAIHEIATQISPHKAMAALLTLSKIPDRSNINHSITRPQHTFSDSIMEETVANARLLMAKWNPTTATTTGKFTSIFHEDRGEAEEFIARVEELRRAMHFLIAQRSYSAQLAAANNLMKAAMLRLEKEFYYILSANRDCLSPESVSDGSSRRSRRSLSFSNSEEEENEDGEAAMADLKMIAESMISSGYSKECGKIYRVTRKSIVDEEIYRLGIRSYDQSRIMRLDHKSLQRDVEKWIQAAKIAVKSIFRGEKLLCDRVFAVSETMNQTCIAHTTTEAAMNLLRFPELVAKSKRSPEKIFLLMNLFETVSDLWPEIESIFAYESLSPIKSQALASIQKLSESAQATLADFVSSIQKNHPSKAPLPAGGIHPLTYKVMDYVVLLAESAGTLSEILAEDGVADGGRSPFPESYFDSASPSPNAGVASRLAWIILVLLCKLDSKAEIYKDVGLSYLFLANNLQFVVDRVGATALRFLLGEDWLSNLQKKVKLYAANYESVAWAKVMAALPAAPEAESSPAAIKEHFRRFTAAFQAACRKQSAWTVPDPKLRDEIKVSIARKVVPAYRRFYESCYAAILSEERNLEVLVRFSPDNLGNYLSDLFHTTVEISEESSPPASPLPSSQNKLARCF